MCLNSSMGVSRWMTLQRISVRACLSCCGTTPPSTSPARTTRHAWDSVPQRWAMLQRVQSLLWHSAWQRHTWRCKSLIGQLSPTKWQNITHAADSRGIAASLNAAQHLNQRRASAPCDTLETLKADQYFACCRSQESPDINAEHEPMSSQHIFLTESQMLLRQTEEARKALDPLRPLIKYKDSCRDMQWVSTCMCHKPMSTCPPWLH